jgi:hypothetical protein
MSSENDPEARKLSVAELLAQHGGGQTTDGVTGRRRRGEDAAEETAPHAIIDRVRGTNPRVAPAAEPETDGEALRPEPSQEASPRAAQPVTRHLPAVTGDGPTEQDSPAAAPDGTATELQPVIDDTAEDAGNLDAAEGAGNARRTEGSSGVGEWLGILGVIVGGVLGGAAVWLLFNWLWGRAWIVALVVAALVVAGAAVGVRTLWRLRDAVTLILTVAAGLIVTFSPAILLALRSS